MQPDFWHQRWESNQIGFHEPQANPLLVAHFEELGVAAGGRVFLPLCGKTLDIDWLLARGIRVAGVELSSLAVAQLFDRLGRRPATRSMGSLQCSGTAGLDVFIGDMFNLTREDLGAVDAVFDRAALIAMPPAMRAGYAAHLRALTADAPQLLVTLEYDQRQIDGPPFSVEAAEVRDLFRGRAPMELSRAAVPGGLKGRCAAAEVAWKI